MSMGLILSLILPMDYHRIMRIHIGEQGMAAPGSSLTLADGSMDSTGQHSDFARGRCSWGGIQRTAHPWSRGHTC